MTRKTQRASLRAPTRWLAAVVLSGMAQFALADDEYAAGWGPAIGTIAPLLSAKDQRGELQSLETLTGPNGLLLVFNRSVDW